MTLAKRLEKSSRLSLSPREGMEVHGHPEKHRQRGGKGPSEECCARVRGKSKSGFLTMKVWSAVERKETAVHSVFCEVRRLETLKSKGEI